MAKGNKKTTRWSWTPSILWRAFIISVIVHIAVMYLIPTGQFFKFEPGYIEVENVDIITFSGTESLGEPENSTPDVNTATVPVPVSPVITDIPTQIEAVEPEIALDRNPDEQWESAFIGLAPESVEDVPHQVITQLVPRTVAEPEIPQTDVIKAFPRVQPKQIPISETHDEPSSEPEIRPEDEVATSVEQPFEERLQTRAIERATVDIDPEFSESQIPKVLDTDFPSLSVSRQSRKTVEEPLLPLQSGDILKAPSKQVPTSDIVDETPSEPEIQPDNEVAMIAEQPFEEWLQIRAVERATVDIEPEFSELQLPEILAIDSPSLSLLPQSRQEFGELSSPDPSIIPVQPETIEKALPPVVVLPDVPARDIAPDEESIAVVTSRITFPQMTSLSTPEADIERPEFVLSSQIQVSAQQIQTPVVLDERQKLLTKNIISPRMTPVSKDETRKEPILPQEPVGQPSLPVNDIAQVVMPTPQSSGGVPQQVPEDAVPIPLPETPALASIEPPPSEVQEFRPILRTRTLLPDRSTSMTQPAVPLQQQRKPILLSAPVPRSQPPVGSTDVQTQAVLPERRPSQMASANVEQASDAPRFAIGLRQPQRELQSISSPGRPTLFAETKRSSEVNDKEETTSLFSGQAQFGLPIKKHIMLPEAEASNEMSLQPEDAIEHVDKTDLQDPVNAFVIEGPAATRQVISKPRRFPAVELEVEVDIRLQFWVLPDGTVGDVIPLERGDVRLERAAIEYIKNWRFTPVAPSQPPVWGIMPITYMLR